MRSTLKRETRIAFGICMVGSKHLEEKRSLWTYTISPIKRTVIGIPALTYGLIKPLHGKSRKEHLQMILLDITFRWAYYYGVLKYLLGSEKCGDLPNGTKSGKKASLSHN